MLGPIEIVILLLAAIYILPRIKPIIAVRNAPHPAPRGSPLGYGWLVVPTICLIVIGQATYHALVKVAPPKYEQQLSEIGLRNKRMAKVVQELTAPTDQLETAVLHVPEWLKTGPGSNDQILLTSDQFSSRPEAEDQLLPLAQVLLQQAFHRIHPWEGAWTVPLSQIRERVVENQFVEVREKNIGNFSGDMYRLHMLVNVSPNVSETFVEGWKSQIVLHRLKILGVLVGWLSVMFTLGAYYFGRSAHPENSIGWMSKLATCLGAIGLTVLGHWLITVGIQ